MDHKKMTISNLKMYNTFLLKKYNNLTFTLKEKIFMYSKSIYG